MPDPCTAQSGPSVFRQCPTAHETGLPYVNDAGCKKERKTARDDASKAACVALEPPGAASAPSPVSAITATIATPPATPATPAKEAPEQPQQAESPDATAKESVSKRSKHEVKPPLSLNHTSWWKDALPVIALRRAAWQDLWVRSAPAARRGSDQQPLANRHPASCRVPSRGIVPLRYDRHAPSGESPRA